MRNKIYTSQVMKSLEKELHYVFSVSRVPVTVEFPDGVVKTSPPRQVVVSDKFFRDAECKMCGKCCTVEFTKFWTPREFEMLSAKYPENVKEAYWFVLPLLVNGRKVEFHCNPPVKGCVFRTSCMFHGGQRGCLIHECNPVHCRVPLIKFKELRGRTYVTKEPYGRNYRFGCKAQFVPLTRADFESWDLDVMRRVRLLADDLGVPTHLEWVEKELKRRFHESVMTKKITEI